VVALAGLLVLWGHATLRVRLTAGSEPRLIRVGIPAMAAAGAILATAGLWSVFTPTRLDRYLAVPPLSLALGSCCWCTPATCGACSPPPTPRPGAPPRHSGSRWRNGRSCSSSLG
jgi:hypothetical protein